MAIALQHNHLTGKSMWLPQESVCVLAHVYGCGTQMLQFSHNSCSNYVDLLFRII
jgi:hypothetical protein